MDRPSSRQFQVPKDPSYTELCLRAVLKSHTMLSAAQATAHNPFRCEDPGNADVAMSTSEGIGGGSVSCMWSFFQLKTVINTF